MATIETTDRRSVAHKMSLEAHDRVARLETEMHSCFAELKKAMEEMRKNGAELTVMLTPPMQAAWSVYHNGDDSLAPIGLPDEQNRTIRRAIRDAPQA